MLRHRLVRQSAMNISSSSDSIMPSPQPIRRRRDSQDSKMYRQLSTESLDNLLGPLEPRLHQKGSGRRHSVACGVLYVDIQKPSLKSAFNTALKRMSSACSMLSSAPSSTFNLATNQAVIPPKKEEEVLLPQVLGTYRQNQMPQASGSEKNQNRINFQVNRRFSTDCPPPTYTDAINLWNQPVSRQKLIRQQQTVSSKGSLLAVQDDDLGDPDN